jgi:hypothetical protein
MVAMVVGDQKNVGLGQTFIRPDFGIRIHIDVFPFPSDA